MGRLHRGSIEKRKAEHAPPCDGFIEIGPPRSDLVVVFTGGLFHQFRHAFQDSIGTAISNGLFREEPFVAVKVAMDLFGRFTRPLGHELVHAIAQAKHVLGFDAEIRRRTQ